MPSSVARPVSFACALSVNFACGTVTLLRGGRLRGFELLRAETLVEVKTLSAVSAFSALRRDSTPSFGEEGSDFDLFVPAFAIGAAKPFMSLPSPAGVVGADSDTPPTPLLILAPNRFCSIMLKARFQLRCEVRGGFGIRTESVDEIRARVGAFGLTSLLRGEGEVAKR